MFSKGDLVYIYLFDLEKTLPNMKKLRDDRFGIVFDINVQPVYNSNSIENEIIYKIKNAKGEKIEYRSTNLVHSMIHLNDLIELIGRLKISQEEKHLLLEQINNAYASLK